MTTDRVGRATARRGLMLVVLAAALWGTSGVATKTIYTLVDISPITVAAFRLALGAPLLLVAFRLTSGQRSFRVARADLAWMLLAGAALGMSQACYFAAIVAGGRGHRHAGDDLHRARPGVSLLGGAAAGAADRAVVGSLACALIGTVLLIGVGRTDSGLQASAALGGIALALAAAFGFAGFILVSRLLANRYHPLLSITIAVGIGAVLLLAVSAITTGITVSYPRPVWALFLYLGLVPTALGYALFYLGVQHTTASEASVASLVEPLTATGLALILFGEHLGASGLLGAALLIGAIVFLYRNGPSRAG